MPPTFTPPYRVLATCGSTGRVIDQITTTDDLNDARHWHRLNHGAAFPALILDHHDAIVPPTEF